MKKILFIIFISFSNLMAQEHICGSQIRLNKYIEANPESEERRSVLKKKTSYYIKNKSSNITIPVVVHILYNNNYENISDAQIYSQIDVLNKDFTRSNTDAINTPLSFSSITADMQINFCLAQQTPNGNPTNGIIRKQTNKQSFSLYGDDIHYDSLGGSSCWDTKKYLNLWVCNIDSGILGWAQFPGGGNPETDGVVIDFEKFGTMGTASSPYNLGRTTTHEIGHWLNLWHIWGDNTCGNDFVNDTPEQEEANYGCKIHPHTSCNNNGDMFMNFMDYTNDACMNSFTQGQKNRVWSAITNYRYELLNANGCQPINNINGDAGILKIINPNSLDTNCADAIYPKVILKNFGNTTLNSVIIKYSINSGNEKTYNWIGILNTTETDTITLPVISSSGTNHLLSVSSKYPNGNIDVNPSNDEKTILFSSLNGKLINIQIRTDNYAHENSWILKKEDNEVIESNNNLISNHLYNLSYCLDYGCYKFIIYDSYGDGLCCDFGNGFYNISEATTSMSYSHVSQFLFSDTTYFCIGNTSITENKEKLLIFPNPSDGKIYINHVLHPNNKFILATVFNSMGQLVYYNDKHTEMININDLENGVYQLIISTQEKNFTKKIILNK